MRVCDFSVQEMDPKTTITHIRTTPLLSPSTSYHTYTHTPYLNVSVAAITRKLSAWDWNIRMAPSLGQTLTKTVPASAVSNLCGRVGCRKDKWS